MTREQRSVALALLIWTTYAISNVLMVGSLIYPYPLNSLLFAVIAFQFAYWNRAQKQAFYVVLLAGVLGVLSNQMVWELLLSVEKLTVFYEEPWLDLILLLYLLVLAASGIATARAQELPTGRLLAGIGSLTLLMTAFLPEYPTLLGGLGLISLSVYLRPVYEPFHLLWYLLLGLESFKYLTYFFAS